MGTNCQLPDSSYHTVIGSSVFELRIGILWGVKGRELGLSSFPAVFEYFIFLVFKVMNIYSIFIVYRLKNDHFPHHKI